MLLLRQTKDGIGMRGVIPRQRDRPGRSALQAGSLGLALHCVTEQVGDFLCVMILSLRASTSRTLLRTGHVVYIGGVLRWQAPLEGLSAVCLDSVSASSEIGFRGEFQG